MDANQLIKALADAANAAKPPQEYCLFWIDWWPLCMTKAEWSGWMQVIGAVSALGIAIALPYWQKRVADRESFNRARQCLLMQCGVIDELLKLAVAAGEKPRAALRSTFHLCANLAAMHDEVRLPHTSLRQLANWRTSRVTIEQLIELVGKIREEQIDEKNVLPALQALMKLSKEQLDDFGLKPARDDDPR
ncbi:hypothetical protein [Acidovorax delafieldii]|uniref:hypothetical protein n=1 Tax=Acidovorax delafieldii TaxID=47920 RepID=UPI003ECF7206